jgi:hypothetical protein
MAAGALALLVATVSAHDVSRSESTITIDGAVVHVRFAINLLELAGVDGNRDQRVSYDELEAAIERVFGAIKQHYVLRAPAAPVRVVMERQQMLDDHVLHADLVYTFDSAVRRLMVESTLDAATSASHLHHVNAHIGGQAYQALLTPTNRTVTFLVGGVTFGRIFAVLLALLGLGALVAYRVIQKR